MTDSTLFTTDHARLWESLMEMARIGATPGGGVGRLALTDLDREARDLFVGWCKDSGCDVRVDRLGNIFARRPGTEPGRAPVMTGSHLDTQPLGGKFDGIYGVLAGLEVVRTLNEREIQTQAPLDIVVWTDEEGVRFGGGCAASGAFAGVLTVEHGLALVDSEGKTLGEELERIGYAGTEPVGGFTVDSFFEAHIEQGPVLEAEGKTIGVVLGGQGQKCFLVTVTGEEGHAGTLPMTLRKDAMVGAARMMAEINEIAFRHTPNPVITTGHVRVRPNSRNTIPGQVIFTIDERHPDDDVLETIDSEMADACEAIAAASGLDVAIEELSSHGAVEFDPSCIDLVRDTAEALGLGHREMFSGAGHDAFNLAQCAPTGMIFVPCKDGISHNERESARAEDLGAGCDVLLNVMLDRAR